MVIEGFLWIKAIYQITSMMGDNCQRPFDYWLRAREHSNRPNIFIVFYSLGIRQQFL
jgi:hypothetical protein